MLKINKQTGVALVVVLLVVALVSMIATDMTGRLQYELRRSANVFDQQQAQYYALGAEKFAIAILQQNMMDSPHRDYLDQAWARQGLYFPVEGGDLTGVITDANRCFNLNSVVDKNNLDYVANINSFAYQSYQRLLGLLALPTGLSDSLVDWIDTDEQVLSMDGAEDLDYQLLSPAYRSANNLIVDVSELRLIRGYTAAVVEKLSPYVCALPEAGYLKLNINTIDSDKPQLLAMMIKDLPLNTAATILAERRGSGYDKSESFWQLDALAGIEVDGDARSVLQLDSDYYILKAKARIGRGHVGLTTLFKQVGKNKVHIIWRRFGAAE